MSADGPVTWLMILVAIAIVTVGVLALRESGPRRAGGGRRWLATVLGAVVAVAIVSAAFLALSADRQSATISESQLRDRAVEVQTIAYAQTRPAGSTAEAHPAEAPVTATTRQPEQPRPTPPATRENRGVDDPAAAEGRASNPWWHAPAITVVILVGAHALLRTVTQPRTHNRTARRN